jgi:predicted regulator of Ras-like GTPase activity (Roadblock/LC7/MglB family)
MGRAKTTVVKNKFQAALDYLTEYAGVRGAVIVDSEGLAIASGGQAKFDADKHAAFVVQLELVLNQALPQLVTPGVEWLTIKTGDDWLTVARASALLLVVAADRNVDDLLNIRITRSIDMISSHMKQRYPFYLAPVKKAAREMEEINV